MSVEDGCPVAVDRVRQYQLYYEWAAHRAVELNDRLTIAARLDGGHRPDDAPAPADGAAVGLGPGPEVGHIWHALAAAAPPGGWASRAEVVRETDAALPHLARLFAVWTRRDRPDTAVPGRRASSVVTFADTVRAASPAPGAAPSSSSASSSAAGKGVTLSDVRLEGFDDLAAAGGGGAGSGGTGAHADDDDDGGDADADPSWWGADIPALLPDAWVRALACSVAGRVGAVASLRLPLAEAVQVARAVAKHVKEAEPDGGGHREWRTTCVAALTDLAQVRH